MNTVNSRDPQFSNKREDLLSSKMPSVKFQNEMERVIPLGEKLNVNPQSASQITALIEPSLRPLSENSEHKKTKTYVKGFFNRVVANTGKALIKVVETSFFIEMRASHTENLAILASLTGQPEFGIFLSTLSRAFAQEISENVFEEGILKECVEGEENFLADLLQTLLVKMAVNVGNHLAQERGMDNKTPITPIEIFSHLINSMQGEFNRVQERLEVAKAIINPKDRLKAQQEAVAPLLDQSLHLAFPKGVEELPLRKGARTIVWNYLKNKILGPQFIQFSAYVASFKKLPNAEAFKKNPDNALLGLVCEKGPIIISEWAQEWMAGPQISSLFADKILSILPSQDDQQLKSWISNQLMMCAKKDNPSLMNMWSFFTGSIEPLLVHIFTNLSKGHSQGEEASVTICMNLMKIASVFKENYSMKIEETYVNLQAEKKIPETDPHYIELFIPLATELQKRMGLILKKESMPGFFKKKIENYFSKQLPILLAKHYFKDLVPLTELYHSMVEEEGLQLSLKNELYALSNGQTLANGCQLAGKQGVIRLQEVFVKKAYRIGEEGANSALNRGLPWLKNKTEALILSELEDEKKTEEKQEEKEVSKLSDADSSLKHWLKTWISNHSVHLAQSQNSRVGMLWKFIEHGIDALLAHIFLHAAKEFPQEKNATLALMNRILDKFCFFAATNSSELHAHYTRLKAQGIEPENDEQFVALFKPFCKDLIYQLGMDDETSFPLPKLLYKSLHWLLGNRGPKFFAAQYRTCLSPNECIKTYRDQLSLLIKAENDPEGLVLATQIENLCGFFAQKISVNLENVAYKKVGEFIGEKPNQEEILHFRKNREEFEQQVITSLLMEGVIHYLQGIKAEGKSIEKASLSEILTKFAKVIETHLNEDATVVLNAANEKDPSQKKKNLRQAFVPLTHDLIKLIEFSDKQVLPLSFPFGDFVEEFWPFIQEKALPDLLAEMYLDTTSWTTQIEANRKELEERVGTSTLPDTCKLLGQFVSDFLPPFLFREREELFQGIYTGAAKYFALKGGPKGIALEKYMSENDAVIKEKLCEELFSQFQKNSLILPYMQPLTKQHVEAALLKVFNNLSQRVEELENPESTQYQQEFLVNLGLRLLKVINEHFQTIHWTTASKKKYAAHHVAHEDFIEGFSKRGILHPAVPQNVQSLKAFREKKDAIKTLRYERKRLVGLNDLMQIEECQKRIKVAQKQLREAKKIEKKERENFLKPFSESFLELAGIRGIEDVPFPPPVKEELWSLMQEDLLPNVFGSLFEFILEPATRNKMVIGGLEALNEALDEIDKNPRVNTRQDDEMQKQLNAACGELVLQVIELVPKSMIKAAFKIDRLQTLSAETVGQAVRRVLCEKGNTMLSLIDKAVVLGNPHLDSTKKTFPESDEELEMEELKKLEEAEKDSKKMRELMISTTHRVMAEAISGFFKAPLNQFKKLWNSAVDKVFGKHSITIRNYFKRMADRAIFRAIQVGFEMAYLPFNKTFWFFVDMYMGYKADHLIKSIQLDIHENLLYQVTGEVFATLKGEHNIQGLIEPLLLAAERRKAQEENSVERKYFKIFFNSSFDWI